MKLLVLGGTVFLGRHFVERALECGHEVTLFNRGLHDPSLFPEVEKLRGDRDGDLEPLRGRRWDAVVDTSGYVPRVVQRSAELLEPSTDHYTFVSSISVYADASTVGIDESAPVAELHDVTSEDVDRDYGALKASCERVVAEVMGDRACSIRAGLLVGPHDPTDRFTYWVRRIAAGGAVLAPEPRDQPVQLIDARDLARWMVEIAEHRHTGVFNASGPVRGTMTMQGLLETISAVTSSGAELVWVEDTFLLEQGVEPWSDLPLWLAPRQHPSHAGFLAIDTTAAAAAGLSTRPLAETVTDTLRWASSRPGSSGDEREKTSPSPGLAPTREQPLLTAWSKRPS